MSSFALYKRITELEKLVLELKKQNLEILKKNAELEKRLLAYENAHTPPSKQHFRKNPPNEPKGKLGAKVGHPKWERKEPEPTKTIEHSQTNCSHCKSKLVRGTLGQNSCLGGL